MELDLPQGQTTLDTLGGQRRLSHGQGETPQPALRLLLVVTQALGLAVADGDCAQAFLQAPLLEKNDVWITPPPEVEVRPGRAWPLLKIMLGLMDGPVAWGHHATKVKEEFSRVHAIPVYTAMCVSVCLWTLRPKGKS